LLVFANLKQPRPELGVDQCWRIGVRPEGLFCMRTLVRNLQVKLLSWALAGIASNSYAANPNGFGPEAAARAVAGFKVADGLEISLFASEPLVRNPTDMDIDERGRVWVTEGVNYRSTFQKWGVLEPEGDRIITLAYAADGTVKETVFYQDPSINTALGICVLGNKVIVSDSPNVFVLTDTDGDGKADKRELLFTGIGGKDHDHGVHTFVFGPDGKLYFNMGNEGKHLFYPLNKEVPLHGPVENVPMKPVADLDGNVVNNQGKPYRMGMVFRCNPDGSDVETLAWNFRNNYEVAVDSFGGLWQSDNDDDGNRGVRINYLMEFGNYGYVDEMTGEGWPTAWSKAKAKGAAEDTKVFYEWHQYDPGVVPDLLHTGAGSPTGMILYEGRLLPESLRHQMIHCDALPRVVRAYPTQVDGAGYRADIHNLVTTDDQWFRPVDVCAAPDGSLYIADWNDAGVGGHYMADQNVQTMTGRIYRLAPKGNKPSVPPLNLGDAAGCVAALQSPNLSTRYLAWTKLHEMKDGAESSLRKLWKKNNEPCLRARALQLLARIPGKENRYIKAALQDSNPDLRMTGLRIACAMKCNVAEVVQALSRDPSAQVRRECALALRHNSSPDAPKLWAELARQYDGHDRWYLEALGIGADRQWDSFLDAWLAAVNDQWDTPAGREIVWRSRSKKTPGLLVKIIGDKNLTAQQREHYFRSLDFINGPEKEAALLELLTTK
jgi:putative membrane-bound dehydrogenase-like protein